MLRRYRFSFWLTLFATLISLYNLMGFDRDNLVFFTTSIPAWLIEIFMDAHSIRPAILYVLTIGSWFLLGWGADRMIDRRTHT